MELLKAIATRRSVRAYTSEAVDDATLDQIVMAGCSAPIGCGLNDKMHVTVVTDKALLGEIGGAMQALFHSDSNPCYDAPAMIIVSSAADQPYPNLEIANAACMIENMMLEGAELGIGSVIIWATNIIANTPEIKAKLNLPEGFNVIMGAVFGHSAMNTEERNPGFHIATNRI